VIADENDKIQLPMYFASPLKEFPLELVIGARGQKTRVMGATWPRKKFDDALKRTTPSTSQRSLSAAG